MLVKRLGECAPFRASDGCLLRELLQPRNDGIDPGFSLAHAVLAPGEASRPHRLASVEAYHLLGGQGRMHVDQASALVEAGDTVHIPAGAVQWIENTGSAPLVFLAIVCPHWRPEDDLAVEPPG